jgi:RNA polymerase nonessential primary-like sigma factor
MASPESTPNYYDDEEVTALPGESAPSMDLVRVYLQQIGKTPLLNAEQEVELSKDIEAGLYAEQLLIEDERFDVNRPPRNQRMRDLGEIALQGHEAKNRMQEANLRLVVSLAKRYTGRGMPMLDVIQEGNLGLNRAVEKFDYTKGYKFSTYATWWIRQSITRGLADQSRTIRLPVHLVEGINKITRVTREMVQNTGHEPTNEELAAETEMSVEKIEKLLKYQKATISLDMKVGVEDDASLGDFISDVEEGSTENIVEAQHMHTDVNDVLSELPEREATIIRMRFGIGGRDPMTLDAIGEIYGVSRERIRQIERDVMTKLRAGEYADRLRPYIEN